MAKQKSIQAGAPAKSKAGDGKAAPAKRQASQGAQGETAAPKKKRTNPLEFFQQVRAEGSKVTWTSRSETLVSTVMVLMMVAFAALFFFVVDQALSFVVRTLLSLGG